MTEILSPPLTKPAVSVVDEVVYDEATILKRVGELAHRIERDYRGRDLMIVGILKGAFVFTCDLIRNISSPVGFDFISVSRYHPHRDQGRVRLLKDLQEEITGKHVLLVEDIIDTGLTAHLPDRTPDSEETGVHRDLHPPGPARSPAGGGSHPVRRVSGH